LPLDLTKDQIEEIIMKESKTIRRTTRVIIVPGKIIGWKFLKLQ
jgi:leucyl-tRNA synthetase